MTKTGKLYGDSLYELALEKDVEQRTYSKELGCCRSHLFQEKQDLGLLIRHLARRLMSIL